MGTYDKRIGSRVPLQIFLNEYQGDTARRCMSMNLSPSGIYLNRLFDPEATQKRTVGLEFELPGATETVWARGEVIFDRLDPYFHGTGIHFTGMAQLHRKMIEDFVNEKRARELERILALIRRNRRFVGN